MENVEKILFVGLSCIGDVVMTSPLLQTLNRAYPDAVMDFVADKRSLSIYNECPFKGEIYLKDKNRLLRGVPALVRELSHNKYDIVVDVRTDVLPYLVRANKRYTKHGGRPYGPHAVEKLMGVIADIHGDAPIPATCIWLNDAHRSFAEKELSVLPDKGRLLAVSTGEPSKPFKNWTTDRWIEFLNRNSGNFTGVVFIGGPADHEETNVIKQALDLPVLDLVGGCSLLETAAIFEKVKLFIGPDSGPGHLASTAGIPTITLFSTDRPERCKPWGNRALVVHGEDQDARNIPVLEMEQAVGQAVL